MIIEHISVCGFRGFQGKVDIPVAPGFTVIDGRNGVGKSTLFDAIEFALTGHISKYGGIKAAGETIDDYVWWKGEGPAPSERFVEVTFATAGGRVSLRRTPLEGPSKEALYSVESEMLNQLHAPEGALAQLCATSIIRDENIASLSLDLSETQRYSMLRGAIGATDADIWTERAAQINALAKKRSEQTRAEIASATVAVSASTRKVDDVRAELAPEVAVTAAVQFITRLLNLGNLPPDQIISPAREYVGEWQDNIEQLSALIEQWTEYASNNNTYENDQSAMADARKKVADLQVARASLPEPEKMRIAQQARDTVQDLQDIITLGRRIGVTEERCPLCSAPHSVESFQTGVENAVQLVERIDRQASELAEETSRKRAAIVEADRRTAEAQQHLANLSLEIVGRRGAFDHWQKVLATFGLGTDCSRENAIAAHQAARSRIDSATSALRVLETLGSNRKLSQATQELEEAKARLTRAQERAGIARKSESIAHALHDAARRAVSETLDLRLERVLPLMAELYGRLRPHPVWQDIEYAIRGDVKRFLSLQVGEGLNPQFLFSSGQRRATGLAFLLSINLSLAWSRWKTILLDDPVQHIDDFRSVNLAEVLAQLVASGRQVFVAVEDEALAELLTRRMPVTASGSGLRLTLGQGVGGVSKLTKERFVPPMIANVMSAA